MSPHQGLRDLSADPAVRPSRPVGQVFGERSIYRAVRVEIVAEHELRRSHGRPFDCSVHERRMQLRPLRVRRIDTVVDDRRAFASPLGLGRNGEVGGDHLNAFREIGSFASDRNAHSLTSRQQVTDYAETRADPPQGQHAVSVRGTAPMSTCSPPWTQRCDHERPDAFERRIDAGI